MAEPEKGGALGCVALLGFVLLLGNCVFGGGDEPEQTVAPGVEPPPPSQPTLNLAGQPAASRYPVEACKASMAMINGRDVSIMQGRKLPSGLIHVTWRRPDDGKRWQARCEIVDNSHMRWAAFSAFGDGKQGRWRDEDTITVTVENQMLNVMLEQYGESAVHEEYALSTL